MGLEKRFRKQRKVDLAEWKQRPDMLVTRGEVMALLKLHEINKHGEETPKSVTED